MFGEILKELREDANMRQDELALILNVSRSTISMYETESNEPSLAILTKIADTFNVSLDYLLGRSKEKYNLNTFPPKDKAIILDIIKVLEKHKR